MSNIISQNIKTTLTSPILSEYDIDISIEEPHYVYGYGYGYDGGFILNDGEDPQNREYSVADYFNVLSIDGNALGFGIESTKSNQIISSYSYGWGYESSTEILGDAIDYITLFAVVKSRKVGNSVWSVVPDVEVFFDIEDSSVILSNKSAITNYLGIAEVQVRVDASVKKNLDINGGNPVFVERVSLGLLEIFVSANLGPEQNNCMKKINNSISFSFDLSVNNYQIKNSINYISG